MVNEDGLEPQGLPPQGLPPQGLPPHMQLKAHLKVLHAQLAETGAVDDELHTLLRQLDGDIHQLLQQRTATQAPVVPVRVPEDEGLATRAQELAARFAAQHPRMEPALRQLGNMLSNMGI